MRDYRSAATLSRGGRPSTLPAWPTALRGLCIALVGALLLVLGPVAATAASPQGVLADRLATLSNGAKVGGARIAAAEFVRKFYASRDDRPAWVGTAAGRQLLGEIGDSIAHGLRPRDFHSEALVALLAAARSGDPEAVADFEIVATDAAARLLHHLYFGKVNPESLDPDWNFERPIVGDDPHGMLNSFVDAGAFSVLVDTLVIKHPQYLQMQAALARYRAIEGRGGWPEIAAGKPIKPGEEDDRVPALRARLIASGDLAGAAGSDRLYGPDLEAAVNGFQSRHGLDPDGVIGPKSLAALNTGVSTRVNQLRLSLERARWILRGLDDDFVLVNIAGAKTYVVKDGELIWKTRSITGQRYRKTPIFRDEIRYMEFNPTWTVPVSIFRRDKLRRIRRDPGYLDRLGFAVRNSQGKTVSPSSVNWSAKNPGVTLVQRPGPKNALGQVKFMFPNKYAVYLHDTDDRSLFDRAERNLSSGCVRINDPFVFADILMQGDPGWNASRRDAILASGKTTRVDLPAPMPVLLTYYTAWVEDGIVNFRRDIYERDAKLLKALDGSFRR